MHSKHDKSRSERLSILFSSNWILVRLAESEANWERLIFKYSPEAPFKNMITLIPTWRSNHMANEMWDEITYPFPNFKVWQGQNILPLIMYNVYNHSSMLGLKLKWAIPLIVVSQHKIAGNNMCGQPLYWGHSSKYNINKSIIDF